MNPEENELILKTIEGDHAAFSRLVQMHDARVMGITRSILGPGFDAEEVYQDIFLYNYYPSDYLQNNQDLAKVSQYLQDEKVRAAMLNEYYIVAKTISIWQQTSEAVRREQRDARRKRINAQVN